MTAHIRREPVLGGYRQWFYADADAFLAACEGPVPEGYAKQCSGGCVGSSNLFIDYFVALPASECGEQPTTVHPSI